MSEYTRKEREIINRAYQAVEYAFSCHDHTGPRLWSEALRIERGDRGSIHAAKALLVQCFRDGFNSPDSPAAELYGLSHGCLLATVAGAGFAAAIRRSEEDYGGRTAHGRLTSGYTPLHERYGCKAAELLEKCDEAVKVHNENIHRRLASL